MSPETNDGINCPFYGRAFYQPSAAGPRFFDRPFLILISTHGNQCALVTQAHSPCALEIERRPIDWRKCERVQAVRI